MTAPSFPGPDSVAALGIPKRRKTRRGGRKKGGGPVGDPMTHHANLGTALKAGDHGAARSHAFALIRSLPQSTPRSPAPCPTDEIPPTTAPATGAPKPKVANPMRLLGALKGFQKPKPTGGPPYA